MEEREIYLLITRYLQKKTDTEENEILADWLTASPDNELTFEQIKLTWQNTAQTDSEEIAGALMKLKKRIGEEIIVQPDIKKFHPAKWLTIAACIAVISLISFCGFYLLNSSEPGVSNIHLLVTKAGEIKRIRLVDGTIVSLGPKSILRYPLRFNGPERNIQLEGEAYFEVSKNPHRAFKVNTADLCVRVMGTHFNVNASKNQVYTTVSLFEGKVEVNLNNDKDDIYKLKPGQELSVNRNSLRIFQHNTIDSLRVLGWMTKTLVFKNDKLTDAAAKIENMYGVKLVFADQVTADTRIYAQFEGDSLDDVLISICTSGNLNYHKQGNKIYIDKKMIK